MKNIQYIFSLCLCMMQFVTAQVTEAEYFWDTDPGEGSGTAIMATDGNLDQAIEGLTASGIVPPSAGVHTFNIRVKDAQNTWGPLFKKVITNEAVSVSSPIAVAQAEYFWDTDPGEGNGTAIIAFDNNFDQAIETLFASGISVPGEGVHTFNVRIKDDQNTWGPLFKKVITNEAVLVSTPVILAQAEYFWDTDPGEGNGTAIIAFDNNFDQAIETLFASGISVPGEGVHTFNVRIKDDQNTWGPLFTKVLTSEEVSTGTSVTVTQAEYYWNTDPGEGNGETILAVDGNLDQALEKLFKNEIPLVKEGLNTFNIRVKDSENTWGPVFTSVVSVEVTLGIKEDNLLSSTSILSPNPAENFVNLRIDNNYIGELEVCVIDMSGKIVYTSTFDKGNLVFSQDIDIASLSEGVYSVKLNIQNKQTVKRLVK